MTDTKYMRRSCLTIGDINWAQAHIDAQDAKIKALVEALSASVATIEDYIAYEHDGDPWTEDARAMREMDIDYYATDGRLDKAKGLIAAEKEST